MKQRSHQPGDRYRGGNCYMHESISKRHWLGVLEALSLGASVGGSVAAELLSQSILFSAPLSLTLCLSLMNRRRIHAAMQQATLDDMAQLRRDFYQLDQLVLEVLNSRPHYALPEFLGAETVRVGTTTLETIEVDTLDLNSNGYTSLQDACSATSPLETTTPEPALPTTPATDACQFQADVAQLHMDVHLLTTQFLPSVSLLQHQLEQLNQQLGQLTKGAGGIREAALPNQENDSRRGIQEPFLDSSSSYQSHTISLPREQAGSWTDENATATQEFADLVAAIVQLEQLDRAKPLSEVL